MSFQTIWRSVALMLLLVLAGCGGGGGSTSETGTPVLPGTGSGAGGGGTASPTIVLALSRSDVTAGNPATVTVTVRNAQGGALADVVVDLSTSRGQLANLDVPSVKTGADGTATATLTAAGALSGADEVLAVALLGTTTINASAAFTVAGSEPTLQLALSSSTLRGTTGPATLTATARNAAGVVVSDALLKFESSAGQVTLSSASAKTGADGVATISVSTADPSKTTADTVRALWVDAAGETIAEKTVVVQTVADTPTLTLLSSSNTVSAAVPASLSILVKDATGQPVGAGTVVTVRSAFGLLGFDATTAVTNASGFAQVLAVPKTDTSNGADQVEVSATVGQVTTSAKITLQVASVASTTIEVSVSPVTFSAASPSTVTVTARDARGNPVSGVVVDLTTTRGGLALLGVASLATRADGTATTTLTAAGAGVGGADQVVGTARIGTATVQANASFTVAGSVSTLSLTSAATTLRASDGAVVLSAVLRDATGAAVAGSPVVFGSTGGRVRLSSPSALTNANGVAQVTMTVADAAVTAAETLTASAAVGGTALQATASVQLVSALPTLTMTASSTEVSSINPATLSVLVKDAAGNAVPAGTLVSLASTFGFTGFDAPTALTNASGVARFTLTPASIGSNGADQLTASATVGGFQATAQTAVQVLATGSMSVSVAVSPRAISGVAPGEVTVTVRDNRGNGVAGAVVDLSTVKGTLAAFSLSSVLTDATGSATASLSVLSAGLSGADEVLASARIGSLTVTGSTGFTVQGARPTIGLSATDSGGQPTTTLRASTGAANLAATVLDASGRPVPNVQVAFAAVAGRVLLSAPSALTGADGKATVSMRVSDPSVTAADTVTASATVSGVATQGQFAVQLLPDTPTLSVSVSPVGSVGGVVSDAVPATVSVLVNDAAGNPVAAGTIVSIRSNFNLTSFSASTAATNGSGVATFVVRPTISGQGGADQLILTATVGGVSIVGQTTVQVMAPGAYNLGLSLSSTIVTPISPATLTVRVTDPFGTPVAGSVVDLSTVNPDIASLSSSAVLTDANGVATVQVNAAAGGVSGATQILAELRTDKTTNVGTANTVTSIGVSVTAARPVIQLELRNAQGQAISSLRGATDGAVLVATLRSSSGGLLSGVQVDLSAVAGRLQLGATAGVTDANGQISVSVAPADVTKATADTLTASAIVEGLALQGSLVVSVQPAAPTLALSTNVAIVTVTSPATVSVLVRDASGAPVGAGTVASIVSTFGLAGFDAATALTNADGVAKFLVTPRNATSNGAEQLVVSANVGGVSVSAQLRLTVLATASATVTVNLSSGTVTIASPATATVTVRDLGGNPVSGALVDLSQLRGNLAGLSATSVVTDQNGTGSVVLAANSSGISGADQVIASVRGTAAATQGSAAFAVVGSAPTLNLAIDKTTLRASTSPAQLTITLRDAAGAPVAGRAVGLSAAGDLVSFTPASVVTDANGQATAAVRVINAGLSEAETMSASATVAGGLVQSSLAIQLLADQPTISISGGSTATATQPAVLSILVRDTAGNAVPAGTLLQVASAFGLSNFDATSISTDANGTAQVSITPRSPSSNGADQIIVTATVGGVAIRKEAVVQVSSSVLSAPPTLQTSLSSTSINSASPATVTATLADGKGQPVAGEVVTFTVVRGLATTNVATALTDANGRAVVVLVPASSATAGADEVTAQTRYAGTDLQSTKGFQVQATNVTLAAFTASVNSLGAYGQTTLTLTINGAAAGSPVSINVSSSCVLQGKATLSPSSFTATTTTVELQYKDNGCGALQSEDRLLASIVGGTSPSVPLTLPIVTPESASLAFISASPEIIYLKGSGFTETSTVVFELRDRAGNTLPNRDVLLSLLTDSAGLLLEGGTQPVTRKSDAAGRVSVQINSGAIPTPVRIQASLAGSTPPISTVSSNLSVGVGLPSQQNFSLSQRTRNIEGMNIDGATNTYTIIASDRSGNPVPTGTSINFVTESGQIEAVTQTGISPIAPAPGTYPNPGTGSQLSLAVAGFQSSNPRPEDGRVTVTAYAAGEESFIDVNGNNQYDTGEPFQDLGDLYKDRLFDGVFDASVDEVIPLGGNRSAACVVPGSFGSVQGALLSFDVGLPSRPSTCDATWSGPGGSGARSVYVRRSIETVLSTSAARLLWADTSGLGSASCAPTTLQVGSSPLNVGSFAQVNSGQTFYFGRDGAARNSGSLIFTVGDANQYAVGSPLTVGGARGRLNPVAAGSIITASTPTDSVQVRVGGGSPVPSTSEASNAVIGVTFQGPTEALVFVTVTSPSGLSTTYAITVRTASKPGGDGSCSP